MSINISYFAGAGAQFFDDNGTPLVGGLIYVYSAGTTTPATTYTTIAGNVNNTNPIVLDAAGRTPNEIWLNGGVLYKFVVKTALGVTIGTYDNIPAVDDPTINSNLITVTGTNTLIGTATPSVTAYSTGDTYSFIVVNENTGPVTIDIDGVGARDILSNATDVLVAGVFTVGKIVSIQYDGSAFQYVNGLSIPDGSITNAKLAANAVSAVKIQNLNVITEKIADDAVTNAKIAPSAVSAVKIQNANVTAEKLSGAQTGTAPIYADRAWVNFNGTGTISVRESGNVASVTDLGVGNYSITFTTAMPSLYYVVRVTVGAPVSNTGGFGCITNGSTPTTSSFAITTFTDAGVVEDFGYVHVSVLG